MKTQLLLLHGATLVGVCLFFHLSALGQGPWTREALALSQSGQFEQAQEKIDMALQHGEDQDPLTWYVKAFVLKSRFVEQDGRHPESARRPEAIEAALESAKRDPKGRLASRRGSLLSFLAETHLEDAQDAISLSQPHDALAAQTHFEAYAAIELHLDAGWDVVPDAVLLDQQLAEFAFGQAELHESMAAGPWFNWGKACYQNALTKEHNRYRSEYNLAVHTYNQGVRQFKAAENDLDALDGALKGAAILWQDAADGLERALAARANEPSGYAALAVVSEALLKQDKIEWCKAHLEELGQR